MTKPLAIFDIDGTIFRSSLLVELNWKLITRGVFPGRMKKDLDRYYFSWINRKGSYEDYIHKVVELYDRYLDGVSQKEVRRLARDVVREHKDRVYVYTRELIKKIRKTHTLVAISGSPIEIVKEFNRHWRFQYIFGTEREAKKGVYTGKSIRVASDDKSSILLDFARKHNFNFSRSIGVGDTESDMGIFEVVSRPICFNPNKNLYRIAKRKGWKIVVERKDVIYELE